MKTRGYRIAVAAAFALAWTGALHGASSDATSYETYIEQGRLHGAAGNFALAEADYRNALAAETRLFGAQSAAVGETLAEIALQVSNQSRFDEAAALFQRAEPIIQASPSAASRARYASYLALNAANQRKFADALKFAQQATAARRQAVDAAAEAAANGGPPVPAALRGELAHSLRIEVEIALRFDDLATAQASANEALWIISQETGLPLWWRPEAVALVADINARSGRTAAAERGYQDALAVDRKIFGDTAPTARLQLKIGRFYSTQQLYPAALAAYRAGFAILEKDPVARAQIVPEQIILYIEAAQAGNGDHALDAEIFRISQLSASDLADRTIARVAARRAGDDAALAALVNQSDDANRARDAARMALAAESAKPTDERDLAREQSLDAQMKAAAARAVELSARLRTAYPAYIRLSDPGPVELADLRAVLAPGEAVLSFVTGVNASYGLLATANGLAVRRLEATQESLAADITDLRAAFLPTLGQLPNFSLQSSFALYRQLLGPFEPELAAVNHLIVVPQGELSSVPFAVLVSAAPAAGAAQAYSQAPWLVRRMALSNVPSARSLVLLRGEARRRIAAPRAFLGIGDPTFRGAAAEGPKALAALAATCSDEATVAPALLRALAPLPDTRGEIDAISAALGGTQEAKLLGAAASETGLRGQALDQYRVLYFATHGLLPGELRCQGEPALVLSPPDTPAGPTADGVLYANEIAALKLNADLVVLSACNTAAAGGTRFGGGALEGLSDAFFNAGARAVLASHWQVPSAATTTLMTGVFANPMQARTLAEALRRSQLAMIAAPQTAHPFNWAAFTLIGDGAASPGGQP